MGDTNNTWRYENPGIADTLAISGTTLNNLPESQSRTGSAFYQTTRAKCFDLPATSEVWIKFDVYFNGSNRWRAYNGGANGPTGISAQPDGRLNFFSNSSNVTPNATTNFAVLTKNQLQTVLLHMISGSSAGVIEAWVDGTLIYSYSGDVNHGQDFADLYLQSDGAGTFFSNVIISNAQINFDDVVPETWEADVEIVADVVTHITNKPNISDVLPQLYFNGGYAEIPVDVLGGATVFTVEAKFSTTSTQNAYVYYNQSIIIGRDIPGFGNDSYALCVNDGKLTFWDERSNASTLTVNTDAVVNDGLIHTAAARSNPDRSLDIFCDGVIVAHVDNANIKIPAQTIGIANTPSGSAQVLQMILYEARLWNSARTVIWDDIDGTESDLRAWYLPTPTGLLDYSSNTFNATIGGNVTYSESRAFYADVVCNISNPTLNWRYEDCAVYVGTGAPINFHIPMTPEIWARFDVYFDGENRWYAYDSTNVTGITAQTSLALDYLSADTAVKTLADICAAKVTQTFLVHMKSGVTDGLIEVWCGLNKLETFTGNINNGKLFGDFILRSDGIGTSFTELIVSNKKIQPDEKPANTTRETKTSQFYEFNTKTERIYSEKGGIYPESYIDIVISEVINKTITEAVYGEGEFKPIKSVWIKFDVLFDGANSWWAYNEGTAGRSGVKALTTGDIDLIANSAAVQRETGVCAVNQWQNFLVHMESNASAGLIEIWVDGVKAAEYTGNVNNGDEFTEVYLGSDSGKAVFRDFILSTVELTPDANTRTIATAPEMSFAVRHLGQVIAVPLKLSAAPITPAFAVRWAGCNWYNRLVAPNAENASIITVRHKNADYALSI